MAAARAVPAGWLGRRAGAVLRGLGMRALGGRAADVESFGARMRLHPHDNLCEKRLLFSPQHFDARELALLALLARRMKPDIVFLDAGANVGGYSLFVAAQSGPRARILAIEPQPDIHARLVYNIRQNAFATIKTLECALADRAGEAVLFIDGANRGESSMRVLPAVDGGRVRVRAQTLADVVAAEGLTHIDALKLDCEGAEDLILEPFLRAAPRAVWPRLLIVERNPQRWCVDLFGLVRAQGYRETLRTSQNIAYELQQDGSNAA